jgi:hypothetical protein
MIEVKTCFYLDHGLMIFALFALKFLVPEKAFNVFKAFKSF